MKNTFFNNRGILLVAMIFMIVLISLAAIFLQRITVTGRESTAEVDRAQALYLAESGINKAIYYLNHTAPDASKNGSWRTDAYNNGNGTGVSESLGNGTYTMYVETSGTMIKVTSKGVYHSIRRNVQMYVTPNVTTGLVGWWNFDENTGTTAYDSSGNAADGTLTNGPTWYANWGLNHSLTFDGVDDYVAIADNTHFRLSKPSTISVWIYPTSFGGASKGRIIDKSTDVFGTNGYTLLVDNSNTTNGLSAYVGGANCFTIANVITTYQWHHIVWEIGHPSYIYVNGALVGGPYNSNCAATNVANALAIGGRVGASDRNFAGQIDDVRIYEATVLTTDEIYKLSQYPLQKIPMSWKEI